VYLDNPVSDIRKVYAKSRSNGQRNGEDARGLESTWKQKTRDTAPDIRLKHSTHVRTMNYRDDRLKLLVGESLGLAVYRWIKISVE
jgi:hypothetical protein